MKSRYQNRIELLSPHVLIPRLNLVFVVRRFQRAAINDAFQARQRRLIGTVLYITR